MTYDPQELRPTWAGDLSGLALWLALLAGLSFAGARPAIAPPANAALAGCPPATIEPRPGPPAAAPAAANARRILL